MVCEAVAEPDAIFLMMRPEAFCQLIQFRLGSLDNHHFAFGSEQPQQTIEGVRRIIKVVQGMDHMDDVETIGRCERFDVLLPQIEPDVGKLLVVKIILKTATSDCVRIDSRVFDTF